MPIASQRLFFGTRRQTVAAAGLGALLLVVFGPTLVEMTKEWWDKPEYGHGLLMPPVAAWMIWDRRHRLAEIERRDSPLSRWLAVLAALGFVPVLFLLLLGEMRFSWFLKPYAFVAAVTGSVAILWGWQGLKALRAPLVVLFLMCPLPWRVLIWATLPLKRHATVLATGLMDATGLPATLQGNLIHVPGISSLWIADACSGVRSLVSLMSVAVLGCLFWRRHIVLKAVLVASCVPIAVGVNALRIWLTALLSVHVSPTFAEGFSHEFQGFVLFGVGSVILLGWGYVLHLLVPRAAPEAPRPQAPAPVAADRPRARTIALGAVCLLLAVTAFGVYRIRAELGGAAPDPVATARLEARLKALPLEVAGQYRGEALHWSDDVIEASGADAYGAVRYESEDGRAFDVYVGGALRNADNFHSPNVCLPTANWEALVQETVPFEAYPVAEKEPRMQRMLMQRGAQQMVVHFWFQAGDRLAKDEWAVRWYRLWDFFRGRPLQPTLIVVVYIPVVDGVAETDAAARRFLGAIGPYLREVTTSGGHHG